MLSSPFLQGKPQFDILYSQLLSLFVFAHLDWHAGPAADLVGITWPDVRWHCLTPQGSLGYPPGFKFSRMDINKEAAPDEDGELIIASPQTHLRLTEEETTLTTQSRRSMPSGGTGIAAVRRIGKAAIVNQTRRRVESMLLPS